MKMRKKVVAAAGVLAALGLGTANAQWATFDASNLVQNIQQVQQMSTELEKLQSQLEQARRAADQAKQSYDSATGSRGMGSLLRGSNGAYTNVPDVSQLAEQIKQRAGYLSNVNWGSVNGAIRSQMQASGNAAAMNQAASQQVFDQTGSEFATISGLMDQIDNAQDPKAIADLQARIQVQQLTLQNQLIKAQAMSAVQNAQDHVEQQQQMQQAASERFDYYKE